MSLREGVPDYVCDEVEVGCGIHFGDNEGVEVGGFELLVERKTVTIGS